MNGLPAIPRAGSKISSREILAIEQKIIGVIATITDIEELDEARAKCAALEAYVRDKEMQKPMLGAQRRIEARIGQLLGPPKRGKKVLGHEQELDERQRHDFRIIAKALNGELQEPLVEDEWRKSRRAFTAMIRARLGIVPEAPPIPAGQYRVIVADPPWKLDTGPAFASSGAGHDALDYQQMSLEDIADLDVESKAAEDSHLYLWTTNKYVEDAYGIAREWGFNPSVLLVWAKNPLGVGLGDAYRLTCEFILYCRRGSLKEREIINTTWFNWPRGKHSEKPDEFYQMVERMVPAKSKSERLEMFGRKEREGWTVWGEEV